VAGREIWKFEQFQRRTRARVRREKVPTLDEVAEKRTTAFADTLRETLEKAEYKRYDALIDQLLDSGYSATDISSALVHLLSQQTSREAEKILEDEPKRPKAPYPKYESRRGDRGEGRDFREGPRGGYRGPRAEAPAEAGAQTPYSKRPYARPTGPSSYEKRPRPQEGQPFPRKSYGVRPTGDRPFPKKPARPRDDR
jgi:ATP-dependent RNA helicase DeaD